jgi:uncharacterized protein
MIFGHPILLSLMTAFAAFVMSLTGFGYGLVAMGAYPNVMGVAEANFLTSSLAIVVIVINLIPIRRSIRFKILWPILLSALVGIPFGVYGLVHLDERVLRIALGSFILVSLAVNVFLSGGRIRKPNTLVALVAGLLSGALGGAFSISGPPLTFYLSSVLEDKEELKANQLFYFLLTVSARIPLLVAGGVVTRDLSLTAAILVVPMIFGLIVGMFAYSRMPSLWVRRVVQVLLAVSAVSLIVRAM